MASGGARSSMFIVDELRSVVAVIRAYETAISNFLIPVFDVDAEVHHHASGARGDVIASM